MKKYLILLLACILSCVEIEAKVIKVLAIGNSFSTDAVEQYLYELAAAQGDSLVIGNAYIGGCSIDRHVKNVTQDKAEYAYRKIVGGVKNNTPKTSLKTIITDEEWDIISLQQSSPLSGLPDSYKNLSLLKEKVLELARNKRVEIVWHLTWAYAADATHKGFKNYDRSQQQMYDAILATARQELPLVGIRRYIPSGITIQNARQEVGDILTRDGFHLSYTLGRYAAACTWCEFLTGRCVEGNSYVPDAISVKDARSMQRAAHEAIVSVSNPISKLTAADDSLRVLWVGNSYTFFNDLPTMVSNIAASQGIKIANTRVLKGGERLERHAQNPVLQEHLKQGNWDYVVIQERSFTPAYRTEYVARHIYPYAHDIDSMAHAGSPDVKVIYYMTWGHKYGSLYPDDYPLDDTYKRMQERIITTYLEMTYMNDGWCAPVGMAWQQVRNERPDIELYKADCSHPIVAGSYLAAHTIFTTIYQRSYHSEFIADLPSNQAYYLQKVAQKSVLDNMYLLNLLP